MVAVITTSTSQHASAMRRGSNLDGGVVAAFIGAATDRDASA
jgi:hypothetical protein